MTTRSERAFQRHLTQFFIEYQELQGEQLCIKFFEEVWPRFKELEPEIKTGLASALCTSTLATIEHGDPQDIDYEIYTRFVVYISDMVSIFYLFFY